MPSPVSPFSVAVVGAGYAGMACAVELARRGVPVTVFERATVMGGRARVVRHAGHVVDNGQHLLIGAYTELMRLMRVVKAPPKNLLATPLELCIPQTLSLKAAPLPAPLHLAGGLLTAKGLSWADKLAMVRLMRYLKKQRYQLSGDMPVSTLLTQTRQTAELTAWVWDPLCIAALNTPIRTASAQLFANVLRDSLGASAHASHFLYPRVDLTELFPVPAAQYLATHHGVIHIGTPITAFTPTPEGYTLTGDPQGRTYTHLVLATAPYHATRLLAPHADATSAAAKIAGLAYNPITTAYLQLDATTRLPAPMIGVLNGPAQWVFDRGQCCDQPGLLAAVSSAPDDLPENHEILVQQVLAQLRSQLPMALSAPIWTQVITEKRATFACTPGLIRPEMETGVPRVLLAGDYVAGDYPATLEGAVRSGLACARHIAPQPLS